MYVRLGHIHSSLSSLVGMLLQQTFRYFRLYPNDPKYMKIWVCYRSTCHSAPPGLNAPRSSQPCKATIGTHSLILLDSRLWLGSQYLTDADYCNGHARCVRPRALLVVPTELRIFCIQATTTSSLITWILPYGLEETCGASMTFPLIV